MKKRLNGGFTLIELVVVIVILGILMAVAIPKYIDITDKAKRAADKGQLGGLRTATHLLFTQNIVTGAPATNAWPTAAAVWAQMQNSNKWQYYGASGGAGSTQGVYYTATNGVWAVTNGAE